MNERAAARFDLEADLRALAGAIDWPPTPDVGAAVSARLAADAGRRRPRVPAFRLGRPILVALLLLALVAAVAAAIGLGLPGLRISVTSSPLPTPNVPVPSAPAPAAGTAAPSAAPGAALGLGRPVTMAEAAQRAGIPILVPDVAGRDGPDAIYLELLRGSAIVTMVWRTGPDLPPLRAGSDVGLLVTEFAAVIDDGLLQKILGAGTTVEPVRVRATRGIWISGAAHVVW